MSTTSTGSPPEPTLSTIPISLIRTDGETQHRFTVDPRIVAEYAALIKQGVEFPPIRVWWDGKDYWLSDGFHRLAATESAGVINICCEIRYGALEDARWDSYAANSTHGLRRKVAETRRVIHLAVQHPRASKLSNVEIAKHLNLPETTVRRWRRTLSSPSGEDRVRLVTRGKATYALNTANLGKHGKSSRVKSRETLRRELGTMKKDAQPNIRRLLVIIEHWAFGGSTPSDCLKAIKRAIA